MATGASLQLRRSADRGRSRTDWLDSRHSFSFAGYRDPAWDGFRALRVLNEDRVAPDSGFGPHPHREMEILTLVLAGSLQHRDSGGSRGVLQPGALQRMSAGTGILHSEWNASRLAPVHFLQIWLHPEERGREPSYEEGRFGAALARFDEPVLLASPDGREGSLRIGLDATLTGLRLPASAARDVALAPGRHAWLQILEGRAIVNGEAAEAGDGVAVSGAERIDIRAEQETRLLLFDLA